MTLSPWARPRISIALRSFQFVTCFQAALDYASETNSGADQCVASRLACGSFHGVDRAGSVAIRPLFSSTTVFAILFTSASPVKLTFLHTTIYLTSFLIV